MIARSSSRFATLSGLVAKRSSAAISGRSRTAAQKVSHSRSFWMPRMTSSPPPFPIGGGDEVILGIQNEREWETFCAAVLERPEIAADERFATNPLRVANRDELRAIIEDALGHLGIGQVTARLDAVPAVGEHTDAILRWLGVTTEGKPGVTGY